MTRMMGEWKVRQSITTESCHILLNRMALPNSTVMSMIEIPAKTRSDRVLEDHRCNTLRNCYRIELHHFIRDRILSTTLILRRSSFRSR